MIVPAAPRHGISLLMIEGGLTVVAVAIAFAFPKLGLTFFTRIERVFKRLSYRKALSITVVGASAFLLRLAILPLCPIPQPFVHDDFSYLLAADTFAHGRLTNPTPAMWVHFESVHIDMKPTYQSMYFPAPGMVLAAGKVVTGRAWFGLLFITALMCATLCWMLQVWLPPPWALLGGFIAVLRLGLFSYWINTYTGGGSVAALGGALVLGALPRLMRGGAQLRHGMLLAVGIILLANSRPYEGLLLCLPVAFILGRWIYKGKNRPPAAVLLKRAALPLFLIIVTSAWMGYYNDRVFGNPLTLPYKINRATYAVAPYWVWQPLRPQPVYRYKVMQEFYCKSEVGIYRAIHSLPGFIPQTLLKVLRAFLFFAGILLLPPLVMMRRVFMDRRTRLFICCVLILAGGESIEIFLFPHYLAPFTAAFYALGLQAMRHLRLWRPGDQPVGKTLVRLLVTLCLALTPIRLFAAPLHVNFGTWPSGEWATEWYGPGQFGAPRAQIEARLEHLPGRQLAIVRYSPDHNPAVEWVYNAADIDHSKVIWARDMGPAANLDLIHYYKDRTVWLVQPDTQPVEVTPYPPSAQK